MGGVLAIARRLGWGDVEGYLSVSRRTWRANMVTVCRDSAMAREREFVQGFEGIGSVELA